MFEGQGGEERGKAGAGSSREEEGEELSGYRTRDVGRGMLLNGKTEIEYGRLKVPAGS